MLLSLQAVIMAGGEGVRLRPLTVALPKPLVPVVGEPVMGYALKLLKTHGVTDVTATLCYQPRKIREAFGRGEKYGVKLRYFEETTPMGTAGGVRAAARNAGTTLVLSGDGLTDCDLTAALAYHREKGALATLVLKRSKKPLSFGVVMTDRGGRVTRFIEKPSWNRAYSDLVNTGVYLLEKEVFEQIPALGAPDFGRDVFPSLLEKGLPVYGYEMNGYWCDVGDRRAYLAAQAALMRGETSLPCASGVSAEAIVDGAAEIVGLCAVGAGAVIGAGARIVDSVIGENAVVGDGAVIEKSCLWKNAVVEHRAVVTGAVICDGASVRRGAVVQTGCAVGARAVLGADAEMRPGTAIFPYVRVPGGAAVEKSLHAGDSRARAWTADGAECLSPSDGCELCEALIAVTRAKSVCVSHDGEGLWLARVIESALAAQGADVLSLGEGTHPMLLALTETYRAQAGVFCEGGNARLCGEQGEPFDKSRLAAMENALLRREKAPPAARAGDVKATDGATAHALECLPPRSERALWTPLVVVSDRAVVRDMIAWGFARMNVRGARVVASEQKQVTGDEIGVYLPPDGTQILPYTERTTVQGGKRALLLIRLSLLAGADRVYDLPGVPRAAGRMAPLVPPDASPAYQRQRMLLRDGVAAVFALAEALKSQPPDALFSGLPPLYICEKSFPCSDSRKGSVLRAVGETPLPHVFSDGVLVDHGKGCARIVPDAVRARVRVIGEAASAEIAEELCDLYAGLIDPTTG